MSDVNEVRLIGRLGRDPEIRYTQSGDPVANFSLATSERWNKDGQQHERTEWHRVEVFGKTAEIVRDYCAKGSQIHVAGSIRYEEWNDASLKPAVTFHAISPSVDKRNKYLSGSTFRDKTRGRGEPHPRGTFSYHSVALLADTRILSSDRGSGQGIGRFRRP